MTGVTSRRSHKREMLSPNRLYIREPLGRSRMRALCLILAIGILLAALTPLAPRIFAQSTSPHITAVEPASGKVNDTVTVTGTNLGKASVAGMFLSDDKSDFKATIVEQSDEKLVFKVPQVKAGPYNVSVQVGAQILILPARFTVAE
jgi:hypothetical protein